jgi:NOL1/NOP2/fmu family ribosome biogenesis protein
MPRKMENLKILNTREKKEIQKLLDKQFDSNFKLEYEVFMNSKNRIYLLNRDVVKVKLDELRINSLGLYFGEVYENEIRLSIEGSEIVGKTAKKNVLSLSDEEAKKWMSGEDFELNTKLNGFVIVKNNNDFLGCGKVSNSKLYNYVPKERRV